MVGGGGGGGLFIIPVPFLYPWVGRYAIFAKRVFLYMFALVSPPPLFFSLFCLALLAQQHMLWLWTLPGSVQFVNGIIISRFYRGKLIIPPLSPLSLPLSPFC